MKKFICLVLLLCGFAFADDPVENCPIESLSTSGNVGPDGGGVHRIGFDSMHWSYVDQDHEIYDLTWNIYPPTPPGGPVPAPVGGATYLPFVSPPTNPVNFYDITTPFSAVVSNATELVLTMDKRFEDYPYELRATYSKSYIIPPNTSAVGCYRAGACLYGFYASVPDTYRIRFSSQYFIGRQVPGLPLRIRTTVTSSGDGVSDVVTEDFIDVSAGDYGDLTHEGGFENPPYDLITCKWDIQIYTGYSWATIGTTSTSYEIGPGSGGSRPAGSGEGNEVEVECADCAEEGVRLIRLPGTDRYVTVTRTTTEETLIPEAVLDAVASGELEASALDEFADDVKETVKEDSGKRPKAE